MMYQLIERVQLISRWNYSLSQCGRHFWCACNVVRPRYC